MSILKIGSHHDGVDLRSCSSKHNLLIGFRNGLSHVKEWRRHDVIQSKSIVCIVLGICLYLFHLRRNAEVIFNLVRIVELTIFTLKTLMLDDGLQAIRLILPADIILDGKKHGINESAAIALGFFVMEKLTSVFTEFRFVIVEI